MRRREIGIRLAVGASRARVTRQLFIENLLLSMAGGAAGLTLRAWSLGLLLSAAGDQIPRWASFALDWRTATFTIVLTILTTLLFGWVPALHDAHDDPRRAIETSGTGSTVSPRGRRTTRPQESRVTTP